MPKSHTYPFIRPLRKHCALLKISPEQVMEKAGYTPDMLKDNGKGVSAKILFRIWNAIQAEAGRTDTPIYLAQRIARGLYLSPVNAFAYSPTVAIGFRRLAKVNPLVGPYALSLYRENDSVLLKIASQDPSNPLPDSLALYEAALSVELARNFTAEEIVPIAVNLPYVPCNLASVTRYFGVKPNLSDETSIAFTPQDANLPIVSEDNVFWGEYEKELHLKLLQHEKDAPITHRAKGAILQLLPSGRPTSDAVCEQLFISRRSLHRKLCAEGVTYQQVLDETRKELSLHYLTKTDLSVDEISYLVAFKNPNAFYRAFRTWTGTTPGIIRQRSETEAIVTIR